MSRQTTPMAIAESICASGPHDLKRFHLTWWMKVGGFIAMLAGCLLVFKLIPAATKVGTNANGGKLGGMLVAGPVMILVGIVYLLVRAWYERATQAFEFPVAVTLPGWGVWSVSADMLVLARRRSTICLLRCTPGALASVLDSIDPDGVLEVLEDDEDSLARMDVELPGELPMTGQLRMLGEGAYLLMLGPDRDAEMMADVDATYLPHARSRMLDEKPQKWRPLERAALPIARLG